MSVADGLTQLFDISAIAVEPDALRRVPRSLAFRHDILSIATDGNQLTIVVPDAEDRETIDRVRLITGMHVRAVPAPRAAIRSRLNDIYAQERPGTAPAIRILDELHREAVKLGASDIHIEPAESGGRVRQRVDGILGECRRLDPEVFAHVVSRVKLLAGMDIADRRQPQDGRYAIDVAEGSVDARVSSVPTIFGEKLAIRLLDEHARVPRLEELGMPQTILERFTRCVTAPHGFVVVCGPTGSGKTTTLYAALNARDRGLENICSVEDPVEIRIPGISQVQVNARAGVTFASAMRAFLRQDPDAVMVGEMRDAETVAVAAGASLGGQLVLTSLHSNDALRAVDRLVEMGAQRSTLSAGLSAVLAQRLVRKVCTICHAHGCDACRATGYAGRVALFEALFINDDMRSAIARGDSAALAGLAREGGYESMASHGVRGVRNGLTTLDELRRVLGVAGAP